MHYTQNQESMMAHMMVGYPVFLTLLMSETSFLQSSNLMMALWMMILNYLGYQKPMKELWYLCFLGNQIPTKELKWIQNQRRMPGYWKVSRKNLISKTLNLTKEQ